MTILREEGVAELVFIILIIASCLALGYGFAQLHYDNVIEREYLNKTAVYKDIVVCEGINGSVSAREGILYCDYYTNVSEIIWENWKYDSKN